MDRLRPVRFRFGNYEADLITSELFEKGKRVEIQEKPFQLLTALLRADGNVVTREDLSHQLWPDTHVQVNQGLNAAIRKVRVALKDDADRPRFVETLGSRGYRFVHAFQVLRWADAAQDEGAERIRLAVMPVKNLGGVDDVIAVGATVELISRLGRLHPRLRVLAPFPAEQLSGSVNPDFRRDVKVDLMLTGTVRGTASGAHTTVMLSQSSDDSCIWAETYERGIQDVSAVLDDIIAHISHALEERYGFRKQNGSHVAETTFSVYEAYLRARHFWMRRTPASLMKSIELFESAIAQDPKFVLAYAGLSDTYNVLGMHGLMRPAEAFERAAATAAKALELDPDSPEGLVALGWAKVCLDYDFDAGDRMIKRALEVNPSYSHAHNFHAFLSLSRGDTDAGIEAMHRAQQLDPLSLPINAMLGNAYFYARRFEEAIEYGSKALDLDPHYPLAHAFLGIALIPTGRVEEGTHHLREAVHLAGRDPMMLSYLAHAFGAQGKRAEACNIIDELEGMTPAPADYYLALAYLSIGNRDKALNCLTRSRAERSHWLLSANSDCRMDSLRSDPRFAQTLPPIKRRNP